MKKALLTVIALCVTAVASFGQVPKAFASLDHLKDDAAHTVDVTVDKNLMQLMIKFLDGKDPDVQKIKSLVAGLNGVYVRSFEFNRTGAYDLAEVDKIRKQLITPAWTRLVQVAGKDENTDVYMNYDADKIMGLVIIAAEPRELTVVNIDGTIRPEQITELQRFGVPNLLNMGSEFHGHKPKVDIETNKDKPKDKNKDPEQEQ